MSIWTADVVAGCFLRIYIEGNELHVIGGPVDNVVKLLSKSNPAVLVRTNGTIRGIVTRSDMLHYMMSR